MFRLRNRESFLPAHGIAPFRKIVAMRKSLSSNAARRVSGVALAIFILSTGAPHEAVAALRAGAAAVNITADKPTAPVHDRLMAKILVLDDGSNKAVIIAMDVIEATTPIVNGIRSGVQQDTGIDPANVLINASHNHRASGQEAKDMVARIVGGVKRPART